MKKCLKGETAKKKLNEFLTEHPETKLFYYEDILKDDKSYGYYEEGALWVTFDNRTGYCNTEEFRTELEAKTWLDVEDV